jgi:DNA-binding XRE family transcriptional regulator
MVRHSNTYDSQYLKFSTSKYLAHSFGEVIRKYRKLNGLMQAELAEKLGVTETTIYNWESGRKKPKEGVYDLSFIK